VKEDDDDKLRSHGGIGSMVALRAPTTATRGGSEGEEGDRVEAGSRLDSP